MECGSVFECAAWPRMQMLKLRVTPIMQKILYDISVWIESESTIFSYWIQNMTVWNWLFLMENYSIILYCINSLIKFDTKIILCYDFVYIDSNSFLSNSTIARKHRLAKTHKPNTKKLQHIAPKNGTNPQRNLRFPPTQPDETRNR